MTAILLSSGFTIPSHPDYIPLSHDADIIDSFLSVNRTDHSAEDRKRLVSYNVHINNKNNELYKNYINSKDFNSYLGIAERVYSDLASVPVYIWLKMQLESDSLSPIVKHYLLDFLKTITTPTTKTNTSLYIPFNLRLTSKATDKNVPTYIKALDVMAQPKSFICSFPLNWKNFIVLLHKEKKLLEFFRLVFVDFY